MIHWRQCSIYYKNNNIIQQKQPSLIPLTGVGYSIKRRHNLQSNIISLSNSLIWRSFLIVSLKKFQVFVNIYSSYYIIHMSSLYMLKSPKSRFHHIFYYYLNRLICHIRLVLPYIQRNMLIYATLNLKADCIY